MQTYCWQPFARRTRAESDILKGLTRLNLTFQGGIDDADVQFMADPFLPSALRFEQGTLAERAYLLIRERILRGNIRLGSALSRRKIAAELGMSLVPVSEALQRLEGEGLIESKPRVGTRVYMPTAADIRERYIVREALESQSARLFSEKASSRERAELCRMAEHMDALFDRRLDARKDSEFMYHVQNFHFQLHIRIAECSGCRPLVKLIEQTHVLVFNWVWDMAAKLPNLPPRFHGDLVDVLAGNDPEASDQAMRQHIRHGLDGIVRALEPQMDS
jgi:DNA-binding GntR family transcriptional regulator